MTHNEFITSLSKNNVDSNIIHFENSVAETIIVGKSFTVKEARIMTA